MRDIPRLSGVSKESISMAMGILEKRRLVAVGSDANARGKVIGLTDAGLRAQEASRRLVGGVEERWVDRFGEPVIGDLRAKLEALAGEGDAASPLFGGLEPYPDGWRALVPRPETLPHFPMVLHRGGYPDGS